MIKRARVAAVIVEHDQRTIARFVRPGATLVSIDDIPECPFSLVDHDYVLHAEVNDSATAGAVLLAVTRGIDVVVAVDLPGAQRSVFLDDLARAGDVTIGAPPQEVPVLSGEEHAVLTGLADGRTLVEVAERLGMSRRTATRRLASAKAALGARTTMEALVALRG